MVASPHYLATAAGVDVLRKGGSAVDAAIAANSVLAVVTPYLCGMGGDLFALVYAASSGSLVGLNGSGRAPTEATLDRVREMAGDRMPQRGPLCITVPGCVEAWGRLHARFGRLPLRDVLADATWYARDGFPVTARAARALSTAAPILLPGTPARETFLPGGAPPREGDILVQPRLARTLEALAEEGPEAFYRGDLAREIVRSVRSTGGLLSEDDLAVHCSEWVQPLSVRYRDVTVYELPPNSQGIVALMMLAMLEALPPGDLSAGDTRYVHLLAEVARLAYEDRDAHLTDPDHMTVSPEALLSSQATERRLARLAVRVSGAAPSGHPGDTAYLCAADGEGNLVSLIESNFMGIGSGVMAGETGVMLQNRGAWFSLEPDHVNAIAPGKRTMHTLMPGMAFREDRPWLVFGTMGGSAQPQIHAQILSRIVDGGMEIDTAIEAPRFDAAPTSSSGRPALEMEWGFRDDVAHDLRARGHDVHVLDRSAGIGHAHAIQVLDQGIYLGAADPRTDSLALGF